MQPRWRRSEPHGGLSRRPGRHPRREAARPGSPTERRLAAKMVSPSLILIAIVAAYPIGYAVWLSLHEYSVRRARALSDGPGCGNYADPALGGVVLDRDRATRSCSPVASVFLELLIGLAMAMAMHSAFKGQGLLRTVVLVPWAVLTVVTAIMWQTIFDPNLGFVNTALAPSCRAATPSGSGSRGYAMAVMIFADVWKTAPFMALLMLAGLQVIPGDVYDAAKVDGATAWQRFRSITLPLLMPAILVALIFRTLDALRVFDLPFVLTNGANGTNTLSLLAYEELQENRLIGLGSAMSILTFIIVMTVSFVYIRFVGGNIRGLRRRTRPCSSLRPAPPAARSRRAAARARQARARGPLVVWPAVAAIVVFCLFPFYWLVNTSLKTGPDLSTATSSRRTRRSTTTSRSSRTTTSRTRCATARSSRFVTTLLALVVGSFCAYALARLRFRGQVHPAGIVLSITTFPQIAIAAPLFRSGRTSASTTRSAAW